MYSVGIFVDSVDVNIVNNNSNRDIIENGLVKI